MSVPDFCMLKSFFVELIYCGGCPFHHCVVWVRVMGGGGEINVHVYLLFGWFDMLGSWVGWLAVWTETSEFRNRRIFSLVSVTHVHTCLSIVDIKLFYFVLPFFHVWFFSSYFIFLNSLTSSSCDINEGRINHIVCSWYPKTRVNETHWQFNTITQASTILWDDAASGPICITITSLHSPFLVLTHSSTPTYV